MTSEDAASDTALLDEWRAEVGDDAIAAAVRAAAGQIASGALPSFTNKNELLDYLREPLRRSV